MFCPEQHSSTLFQKLGFLWSCAPYRRWLNPQIPPLWTLKKHSPGRPHHHHKDILAINMIRKPPILTCSLHTCLNIREPHPEAWNVVGSGELQRKTAASVGWKDERWHAQVRKARLKDRPLPKSVNSAQRTATPLYDFTFTCTQEHWSNGSAGLRVPYGLHIYWTNNQKESAFKEESKEEHRKSFFCSAIDRLWSTEWEKAFRM